MSLPIDVWLIHPDTKMCEAFQNAFKRLPRIKIIQSLFQDLPPHDCFVTAGNSYGIMNAGIDAAVIMFHGPELMERIQYRILNEYLGEQPVGTAFVIETGNHNYPFVAHAPTMRTPGSIEGTDKVYMATWAALLAIYQHNTSTDRKINSVALPAMGTGFGGVSYNEAARQMAVAYQHYLSPPHRLDWNVVTERHKDICYDEGKRVVS